MYLLKFRAKAHFKELYMATSRIVSSRNITLANTCLYIACRRGCIPISFKEFCTISNVPKREMAKCFRRVLKKMEKSVSLLKSEDFMARFCSGLTITKGAQAVATDLAKVR